MPKIEYVPKNFRDDSIALISKISDVIKDYNAQGYSLTLRQVYYQMVARGIIPNNERSYKNLGNLINDARLAGYIDWDAIEDRTRNLRGNGHWTSPGDIINSAAYSYKLDRWKDQSEYVEVWVEKDALVGIVGQICEKLDVSYFSCRGYVSQSEMWGAAQRLQRIANRGKDIHIIHLGDHDPSGQDMSRDIQDRQELFGMAVDFTRIALNMDQIEQYSPPPNPTKLTDSRAIGYIRRYGHECWELDALEPKVITNLINDEVLKYSDAKIVQEVTYREDRDKALLQDVAQNWDTLATNWEAIKSTFA